MKNLKLLALAGFVSCFAFSAHAQFTTRSADAGNPAAPAPTASEAAPAQAPTSSGLSFRPRARIQVEDTGESDLPSFTATAPKEAPAEAAAATAGPPVDATAAASVEEKPKVIPVGEVWVYSTDFVLDSVAGKYPFCSLSYVVQNKTDQPIDRLELEFTWFNHSVKDHSYRGLKAGESKVTRITVYRDDCENMNVRPKIKILTCRIGDVVNDACSSLLVVK